MSDVAIVFFSGYGHTLRQAESVAEGVQAVSGAEALMVRIPDDGVVSEETFEAISAADAIIYGSPTYMGGPAWQFKRFADASSKVWFSQRWKNKLAAGFTNSASLNGDKASTIGYFFTLSQQHGQVWVGTGLLPSNKLDSGPGDVNWAGGFAGALSISPSDASPEQAPRACWASGSPNSLNASDLCRSGVDYGVRTQVPGCWIGTVNASEPTAGWYQLWFHWILTSKPRLV